ncbi:MAG: glycosyltransferase family 4 protein [Christensenellales bacterium]|jgi:1,2-diacylglycerol 3-alpha-glucosyltransferase
MKVMHVVLCCEAYRDGWTYQENIIPKYNALDGHNVTVVTVQENASIQTGKVFLDERERYVNEDGVCIFRLRKKQQHNPIARKLRRYYNLKLTLQKVQPKILFLHGIQFLDIHHVIRYVKRNSVRVIIDSHEDYYNSARSWFSRRIVHGILWRWCAKRIEPFAEVIWGTLPIRCDFMVDVYGMPREKVKLLVMGAEDEKVKVALSSESRGEKRAELGIDEDSFVIVTAGKLNEGKVCVINLMQAVNQFSDANIRLVFAGSVVPKLQNAFNQQLSEHVIDAGWQNSEELYRLMGIADLIVFPGSHSVLWEQAIALGKPCVFRRFEGMSHLDLGGNCLFIEDTSTESLIETIKDLYSNQEKLASMKSVAVEKGMQRFSYQRISRESIAPTL